MTTAESSFSPWLFPEDKEPATSFAELRRRAAIDINAADEHPLDYWVNVAAEMFDEAEIAFAADELERTYTIYMRACRIVYKVIPNHSDYQQFHLLADQDVQQRAIQDFPRVMRKIVVPLRMKFNELAQIDSSSGNSRGATIWAMSSNDDSNNGDDGDDDDDDDDDDSQYEEIQESIPSNSLAYNADTQNEHPIPSSHLDRAALLKKLTGLYISQGKNDEAEPGLVTSENTFNTSKSQNVTAALEASSSTPSIVAEVALPSSITVASSVSSPAVVSVSSPAIAPVRSPAVAPARSPVVAPAKSPVVAPAKSPSVAPTKSPAVAPAKSSAVAPAKSPAVAPASSPVAPISSSAVAPTSSPAIAPARSPAVAPAKSSAVAPTSSPAVASASSPARSPALAPARSPALAPTSSPAVAPARSPVVAPTSPSTVASTSSVIASAVVQTPAVRSTNAKAPDINFTSPVVGWAVVQPAVSSTSPSTAVQTSAVKSSSPVLGWAVVQTPAISSANPVVASTAVQPLVYTPAAIPPRAPEPRFTNNLPADPSRTDNSAVLLQQKLKRPILPLSVANQQSLLPPLPSNPTSRESSSSQPVPRSLPNAEFPPENSINPQQLERYMAANTGTPNILFLDIRPREMYERAHLKHSYVVNLEPAILRNGVSGLELENALSATAAANSGDPSRAQELEHFKKRGLFNVIVYYDQNTSSVKAPTNPFDPFRHMIHALYEKEFSAKSLSRPPVLLAGGFEAWARYRGANGVEGSMVNTGSDKTEMQDSGDKTEMEDSGDKTEVENLPVEGAMEVNNGIARAKNMRRHSATRHFSETAAPIDVGQTRIDDGLIDRRQQPTRAAQDYSQPHSSQQANRHPTSAPIAIATGPLLNKALPKLPQEASSSSYAPDSPITPDSPRTPADYWTATQTHTRVPSDSTLPVPSVDRGFQNAVSSNQSTSSTFLTQRPSLHEPYNLHAHRAGNPRHRNNLYTPIDTPPTSSTSASSSNTTYNIYPQPQSLPASQPQQRQWSQTVTPPESSGPTNRTDIPDFPMPPVSAYNQQPHQQQQPTYPTSAPGNVYPTNSRQVPPSQAPQYNDTSRPVYHDTEMPHSRTFEHTNRNAYGTQAYLSQPPHATDSHFHVSQPPSQRVPAMSAVERWRLQAQQAQEPQQNQHTLQRLPSNNLLTTASLEKLRARAWVNTPDKEIILISGWISAAKVCGEQGLKFDSQGDLENAYVYYLRCASIIDEIIPGHSGYRKIRDDPSYMALQKIVDAHKRRLEDITRILTT